MSDKQFDQYDEKETARREDAALKRLLATPPDHKRKLKADASPKTRGRPRKAKPADES
jgi:hypothetical protein